MASSSSSSSSDSGAQPELRYQNFNNLCSLGLRPHLMGGIIVQLLRAHFANPRHIEESSLRTRLWTADLTGGILIEMATRWKPEEAGARPAVLARRGSWELQKLGINDEVQNDADTDEELHALLGIGSHTVFCIGYEPGQVERLAAETYHQLLGFSTVLRSWLDLRRFTIAAISELFEIEEADEHYAVAITVAYAYEERWVLRPEVPVLKTISFEGLVP